jgi:hypothetical protein
VSTAFISGPAPPALPARPQRSSRKKSEEPVREETASTTVTVGHTVTTVFGTSHGGGSEINNRDVTACPGY